MDPTPQLGQLLIEGTARVRVRGVGGWKGARMCVEAMEVEKERTETVG